VRVWCSGEPYRIPDGDLASAHDRRLQAELEIVRLRDDLRSDV
jgi:hypothetical protein